MTTCTNCRERCTGSHVAADGRAWCGACWKAVRPDESAVPREPDPPAWIPAGPEYDGLRALWLRHLRGATT